MRCLRCSDYETDLAAKCDSCLATRGYLSAGFAFAVDSFDILDWLYFVDSPTWGV